ncbi:hypothetical protein GEV33_007462 [Tenebrio molitor]|uniref:Uncharacterized protein n=1 Tax=Tenebrio molitor TaxID=7067 RepID=A0A8J6HIL6_TENMO|nr:hypothetical protein GEV33_007462 [Tenebrio molitor]
MGYINSKCNLKPSARGARNQYNQQVIPPPLQPSVQINIHSLIKPVQQPEKTDNPPIVYSFGQSDFTNKYFPGNKNQSNANNKTLTNNKKITWGLDDTIDYKEDDFADILGSKIKTHTNDKSKENKVSLSQYNLQDILEPLAKASAGTARSQYLSVSRYVAGQPSGVRRDSNISLMSTFSNRKDSGRFSNKPMPGESQGDSDRVNLQGRRDDVVEFTRAVGDDSSKYHRPHRQADHGLHYGRFQTERFCGSGSRRVLSVQVVPGLTGRCRIYPPATKEDLEDLPAYAGGVAE